MSCMKTGRELLKMARLQGVENPRLEHGGKHVKLRGTVRGKPFLVVVSGTPSDVRVQLNKRAEIRRTVKGLL